MPEIGEKMLSRWKLPDDFRQRLAEGSDSMQPPPGKRPGSPERLLLGEDKANLGG